MSSIKPRVFINAPSWRDSLSKGDDDQANQPVDVTVDMKWSRRGRQMAAGTEDQFQASNGNTD